MEREEEREMSENLIHGSDDTFEQMVIKSDQPVLVDFWAPWCGPCRAVGPILEQIADEYAGRARVVKINVDDEKKVAGAMGISSIPTVILFSGGEPKKILIGARPKGEFTELLDELLGG
jgi:thioredoxin 1